MDNEDVLLKVEHLCQYFKMGPGRELKAVDDVSFEIKKGEVFGLVGESGCGKTTTGRSIIKLYDITSGDVYFKGQRICAGTRSYNNEIAALRAAFRDEKAALNQQCADEIAAGADEQTTKSKYAEQIAAASERTNAAVAEVKTRRAAAVHDQKCCDKDYAAKQVKIITEEMNARLDACPTEEGPAAWRAEYKDRLRIAKRERIVNQIQMIFQDPQASLNERAKVDYIISEGLMNIEKGIGEQERKRRVEQAIADVGLLPEFSSRFPHEFSGGQRQRIGIARALIMNPEFIIADEPISALDVSVRAQVLNLLSDMQKKRQITYLFIAHDLSVMRFITDRIGVIHKGRIVEMGETEEVITHPIHPYTRALLSAIPMPDPRHVKEKKLLVYEPEMHDYTSQPPTWMELRPEHFVLANEKEAKEWV